MSTHLITEANRKANTEVEYYSFYSVTVIHSIYDKDWMPYLMAVFGGHNSPLRRFHSCFATAIFSL